MGFCLSNFLSARPKQTPVLLLSRLPLLPKVVNPPFLPEPQQEILTQIRAKVSSCSVSDLISWKRQIVSFLQQRVLVSLFKSFYIQTSEKNKEKM